VVVLLRVRNISALPLDFVKLAAVLHFTDYRICAFDFSVGRVAPGEVMMSKTVLLAILSRFAPVLLGVVGGLVATTWPVVFGAFCTAGSSL